MTTDAYGFPISGGWPEIDAQGMAEVDLLMTGSYGITLPQMMENAGRSLAILARDRFFGGNSDGRRVTVLAGAGGNGGGALTAARRLAGWGAKVSVVLSGPVEALTPVPGLQMGILQKMGLKPSEQPQGQSDLILDGLIGYSLRGAPRGRALDLIHWANETATPVLSLDVPSGFDSQTGRLSDVSLNAAATLTLALPKKGLQAEAQRPSVGELYLADISVPPGLYERLSTPRMVPAFSVADIVRLPN
ncbi:NAD(P)H-hydrate epimerase [Roseovarius sp. 10]|uniref:NAD(P)H-hydrate epimerase n=1 Tax=Roseovarius sp. 10 TaxID=3080563 RepID=UPI00295529F8|nr:NAD(P)H-hydrate epimerase [Roseovarius sp. 10]MDV7202455.1 NAD(P)H-hydrate epimerase [Roseovarius sp. 10]